MDIATVKKDLENQIGSINEDLKNIYLPLEAVLILLGKRTAFQIALESIGSIQQKQKPAWSEDERIRKFLVKHVSEWIGCIEHDLRVSPKDVESEKELAMFKDGLDYLEKRKEQKPAEWKPQPESLEALMYAIEGKWEAIKPTSYLSRRLEDLYEGLVNTYNVDDSLLAELPIQNLTKRLSKK